jgi:hypothetical protein
MATQSRASVLALGLLVALGAPMHGRAQASPDEDDELPPAPPAATPAAAPLAVEATPTPEPEPAAEAQAEPANASADKLMLGLFGGLVVPRRGFGLAPGIGIEGRYALTPALRLLLGVDWALLTGQHTDLLTPPDFPPGQAELIRNTHVVTVGAGAGLRLLQVGSGELVAAAALLLSITLTDFEAYGITRASSDAGPGVEGQLALYEPLGPLRTSLRVGYREALHNLGSADSVEDVVVSALFVGVGVGIAL